MVDKKRKLGRPRIINDAVQKKVILHKELIEYIEGLGSSASEHVRKLVTDNKNANIEITKRKGQNCFLQIFFEKTEADFLDSLDNLSAYIRELIYLDMEKRL